jgi:hypothetical protein
LDTTGTYSVVPDSVYVPALNQGESDTVDFILTPISARKYSFISILFCDTLGNYLAGQSTPQAIFEDESFSSLVIENAVVSGNTVPDEAITVESSVLDDSLNVEDQATVIAHLHSEMDTSFVDSFSLFYDAVDSIYTGTYAIPATAPVGRYDLTVIASHLFLLPDTLEESFTISPLLDIYVSAPDTCTPFDTVLVNAVVTERDDTVGTANVSLKINFDTNDEITMPMTFDSTLTYSCRFVPHDCNRQWETGSFDAGAWDLDISASYTGSVVTDSVTVEVLAPDPAIDSSQVSFYPANPTSLERLTISATVRNLGNAPSDSCLIDLYEDTGDTLVFITGGIKVSALGIGDSTRVTLFTGTMGWSGSHDVVLCLDEHRHIDDRDRSNNRVTRSISVIEPVTDIPERSETPVPFTYSLEQNYPNPFNPITHIEFEIKSTQPVSLDIYDVTGTHVRCLVNRRLEGGRYRVAWNGKNGKGIDVSSGIYFYRIKTGSWESTRKMVLVR